MANRELAVNVHVPASGNLPAKYFEAGSTPDKEYAEQITNENAWSDSSAQAEAAPRRGRRAEAE